MPPLSTSVLCLYHGRADQVPCPSLGRPSGFTRVFPALKDCSKAWAPFTLHFAGAGCFFPPRVAVAEAVPVAQLLWVRCHWRLQFRVPLPWLAFCFISAP